MPKFKNQNRIYTPVELPERMKKWAENLSGLSFADVRVHYNSDEPTKHGVNSYTRNNHIYLASGHEDCLRYEMANIAHNKRIKAGKTIVCKTRAFDKAPIQCWNFKAHLESLNQAVEMAKGYQPPAANATNFSFEDENVEYICSGNLMNDLGENEVKDKDTPGKFDKLGFFIKYISSAITDDSKFIKATHKGFFQYLHCMKHEDDTADIARDYVKFAYRVAKDPNTAHLNATPLEKLIRDRYYIFGAERRIFEDFIETFGNKAHLSDCAQVKSLSKDNPDVIRDYFIGSAIHVIQDSFCASHALRKRYRSAEGARNYNPTADITRLIENNLNNIEALTGITDLISIRKYNVQKTNKHEIADRMVADSIESTPGLLQSTNISALVLATLKDSRFNGGMLDAFFDRVFRRIEVPANNLPIGGRAYRKEEDYNLKKIDTSIVQLLKDYIGLLERDELKNAPKFSLYPEWDDTRNAPDILPAKLRAGQLDGQTAALQRILECDVMRTGTLNADHQRIFDLVNEDIEEIRQELM